MADEIRRDRSRRSRFKFDDKEIVDRVLHFFEIEDQARHHEKEARIQRYAKYRLWTEGKDWPWPDSSDIALPDMMEKSLRMQDTLQNAVMSSRPVIGAKALDKADGDKELTIDRLIDAQVFVEQDGENIIGDLADAFVNDDHYVAFVPWIREAREVTDVRLFDPIPDDILPGEYFSGILGREFAGPKVPKNGSQGWDWTISVNGKPAEASFYTGKDVVELVIRRQTMVYDGPRIIQKEWDEVLYPPRAANLHIPGPSNPHGAAHVILVDHPSVDEIMRLAGNDTYDRLTKKDLDALTVIAEDMENREMTDQKDDLQGVNPSPGIDRKKAPEHKVVTRLMCFDIFDIDGDGVTEDVVWWIIKETQSLARVKLLTEVFPSDPPRRPLVHRSMIPVRGRVAGIGMLEMLEGLHDTAKMILDQTVDTGTIKNVPFFFYRPSGTVKPEIITLEPGQGYPMADPQRDVNFPQLGNQDQTFGLNMVALLQQMQERVTTIGDLQLGRVPQGKASALRTVGGMSLIAGQGEARPERILRRFFGGLAEIWSIIHEANGYFLPEIKKIRMIGIKEVSEDPYQEVKKQQVMGRFAFDFGANVLNTSRQALQQSIQALLGVYVSELSIQLGLIDADGIYRLFREFGFAHGQDADKFLTPPSPDSMKTRIMAEEAISIIMSNGIPDGVPAEPGGAVEHAQKLGQLASSDQIGLLNAAQMEVFKVWFQKVQEMAAIQLQRQQAAQAAQSLNQQEGVPGRPPENAPENPRAPTPVQGGELLDETLPGAGGGANTGAVA